ncbi:hypothetical protein, partial [Corynebacterium sp. HMSC08C04]|uniref:hypothetical protein n=1 Tax=Corynebacterium sp. HMSC08C04 TaxID=1581137 RepID=UPI001AEF672E
GLPLPTTPKRHIYAVKTSHKEETKDAQHSCDTFAVFAFPGEIVRIVGHIIMSFHCGAVSVANVQVVAQVHDGCILCGV